ncbi:hypothetical protein VTK73DRAFT_4153 [Phialemonium thermophilum]|uniref:Heterokaryon incompatibility domain-containing protein n=1 Tax=Phialemonium thermophilum TaxID=223376 RepID=A0ABR3XZD8_9PEZI
MSHSRRFVMDTVLGSMLESFRSGLSNAQDTNTESDEQMSTSDDKDGMPEKLVNDKTTSPFKYESLYQANGYSEETRPIRLIKLLPGQRTADVKIELIHTYLSACEGQYEALSYVWGDQTDKTPIQVHGGTLYIGKNLRNALYNLRQTQEARILWADAICINQENLSERARQVAIMGDIYRRASATVVWLGDHDANTVTAFRAVEALGNAAIELTKSGGSVEPGKGPLFDKYKNDTSIDDAILDSPWWKRAWTLQEVLLAKRVLLVRGRYQLEWDFFCTAMDYAEALEIMESVYMGSFTSSSLVDLRAIQALRDMKKASSVADQFLDTLLCSRRREATDHRDKIFAVLGLVPDEIQKMGIHPDYRKSVQEVYCNATRVLIESSGNLDVLGICFDFEKRLVGDLPSWVPDWASTEQIARPLLNLATGQRRETHASRQTRAQPHWEDNGKTLVLEGHLVDRIAQLGPYLREPDESVWDDDAVGPDNPDESLLETMRDLKILGSQVIHNFGLIVPHLAVYVEWENLAKDAKPTNPDPRTADPTDIYWQTLCAGCVAPGGFEETKRLFHEWADSLGPIRSLKKWKVDKVGSVFKFWGLLGYIRKTWNGYGAFIKYSMQSLERMLGVTKKGYLCLLPKGTVIGDQVFLLKGGRVPVVLRSLENGSFSLVGEAYIHGAMDGKMFKEDACVEVKIK